MSVCGPECVSRRVSVGYSECMRETMSVQKIECERENMSERVEKEEGVCVSQRE